MEHLVMPFDEAVRFKELGGTQDTQFYWVTYQNSSKPVLCSKFGLVWAKKDQSFIEAIAAPIIKTEYQV